MVSVERKGKYHSSDRERLSRSISELPRFRNDESVVEERKAGLAAAAMQASPCLRNRGG